MQALLILGEKEAQQRDGENPCHGALILNILPIAWSSMNGNSEIRVNEDFLDGDDELVIYQGNPFSGVGYDLFDDGSGVEYETAYKDGLPHGIARKWYASGQIAYEVECWKGMAHGKELYWYPSGNLQSEALFEYGIKLLSKSWSEEQHIIDEFVLDMCSVNYKLLEAFRKEYSDTLT